MKTKQKIKSWLIVDVLCTPTILVMIMIATAIIDSRRDKYADMVGTYIVVGGDSIKIESYDQIAKTFTVSSDGYSCEVCDDVVMEFKR